MNYMMVPRILLVALGLIFALLFVLSDRQWGVTDMPRVEAIETLPDAPELVRVRQNTEIGSALVPYTPRENRQRQSGGHDTGALKLGYGYREVSVLRLPFWAYGEFGPFAYYERPWGYQLSGLDERETAAVARAVGHPVSQHSFAVWRHLWGWLFVLALGAILWLHLRAMARWRRETGII